MSQYIKFGVINAPNQIFGAHHIKVDFWHQIVQPEN